MGSLTLVATVVGALVLWRYDSRLRPELSSAVWLPTVWFLLHSMKPLPVWLGRSAADASFDYGAGDPVNRVVLSVLMLFGVLVLLRRRGTWATVVRGNVGVSLAFCLMAVSILWSDYQTVSLRRYIRILGDVVMALVLLSERSPLEAIRAVLRRAAYLVLPLSVVLIKYFRHLGVEYSRWEGVEMWVGVTQQKNSLGILCGIIAVSTLSEILDAWGTGNSKAVNYIRIGVLGVSAWLLFGSRSATAVGVAFGAGLFLLWSRGWKGKASHAAFPGFVILGVVVGSLLSPAVLAAVTGLFGRDSTLTTRTWIWQQVLAVGQGKRMLGTGYGALWMGTRGVTLTQMLEVNSAHNGYIEVYVELGLVGLCVVGLMLVTSYVSAVRRMQVDVRYGAFRLAFLLIVIVHNITESTLLTSSTLWFLFLCVAIDPIATVEPAARPWANAQLCVEQREQNLG